MKRVQLAVALIYGVMKRVLFVMVGLIVLYAVGGVILGALGIGVHVRH
jgi:hypothetical protein